MSCAVRFALGALKGVGERAMEALVAERRDRGDFASLDDFANRIDPKLLNRRQIEALAGAGAFDGVEPDRPRAFAGAESLLACANASAHERTTGQGGLFGGDVDIAPALQLPAAEPWTLAERMTREKEAFGFYFSAHPVEQYEAIIAARGARLWRDLRQCRNDARHAHPDDDGGDGRKRAPARVAARQPLPQPDAVGPQRTISVELFRRTGGQDPRSARGRWRLRDPAVELDLLEGEETPRVTVRGAQPLADIAATAALQLTCRVELPGAIEDMVRLLEKRDDARGKVFIATRDPVTGEDIRIELGRRFALGPDTVSRLEMVAGVTEAGLVAGCAARIPGR
jgi:DNA polymerase-3 subunit alpha